MLTLLKCLLATVLVLVLSPCEGRYHGSWKEHWLPDEE